MRAIFRRLNIVSIDRLAASIRHDTADVISPFHSSPSAGKGERIVGVLRLRMTTSRNRKIAFASGLAATSGVGTLCYPSLAILSENAFVAALQMTACSLLFPRTHWSRRSQRKRPCLQLLGGRPDLRIYLLRTGMDWIHLGASIQNKIVDFRIGC